MSLKGFGKKALSSISKYQHDTRMRGLRYTTKSSCKIIGDHDATKLRHILSTKEKRNVEYTCQVTISVATKRQILFSKTFVRTDKQLNGLKTRLETRAALHGHTCPLLL
jgi:phage gp16-like protein